MRERFFLMLHTREGISWGEEYILGMVVYASRKELWVHNPHVAKLEVTREGISWGGECILGMVVCALVCLLKVTLRFASRKELWVYNSQVTKLEVYYPIIVY
jgi:hypothetical protein